MLNFIKKALVVKKELSGLCYINIIQKDNNSISIETREFGEELNG